MVLRQTVTKYCDKLVTNLKPVTKGCVYVCVGGMCSQTFFRIVTKCDQVEKEMALSADIYGNPLSSVYLSNSQV
jgi:hypothetical protein